MAAFRKTRWRQRGGRVQFFAARVKVLRRFDFFRLAGTVRFERRDGEVTRVRREGLQA